MTKIYYKNEEMPGQINKFFQSNPWGAPFMSWVEPFPMVVDGEITNFDNKEPSVYVGLPTTSHPLREARLFWQDRFIHLVSDSLGQVRIFYLSEAFENGFTSLEAQTEKTRVFLRTDWQRFGIKSPFKDMPGNPIYSEKGPQVNITKYYADRMLWAWRITDLVNTDI